MRRAWLAALVLGLSAGGAFADDKEKVKEGLRELGEFIGGWKGSSAPPGAVWSETLDWSWRFKGDDAWLALKVEKGRHVKSGELRYLPDKKVYRLKLTDTKDKERVYEGTVKDGTLTVERTDPDSKEVQRLTMNTAVEGARLIYRHERKPAGRTRFAREYQVGATKVGESLGKVEKKPECVVSGGAGTMTVSFKGETFHVCCSGCRDEFNANPEKYVKEFKAKKK